jgi:hypothetical protein
VIKKTSLSAMSVLIKSLDRVRVDLLSNYNINIYLRAIVNFFEKEKDS